MPKPYDYQQLLHFDAGTSCYQLDPKTGSVAYCLISESDPYAFAQIERFADDPKTRLAPIELADLLVEAAEEPEAFLFFRTRKDAQNYYVEHYGLPALVPGDVVIVGVRTHLPDTHADDIGIVIRDLDSLIHVQFKAGYAPFYAKREELVRIGHIELSDLPSLDELREPQTPHSAPTPKMEVSE